MLYSVARWRRMRCLSGEIGFDFHGAAYGVCLALSGRGRLTEAAEKV